jgi:P27 family predicted phage terminase small subunit
VGLRGPRPTPKAELALRGSWRAKGREDGAVLPTAARLPKPPSWLSAEARKEWRRLGALLAPLGLLTPLDTACFAVLCETYAAVVKLHAEVEQKGRTYVAPSGMPKAHPASLLFSAYARDLVALALRFGCTPDGRLRLNLKPGSLHPQRDPFDDYLAEYRLDRPAPVAKRSRHSERNGEPA